MTPQKIYSNLILASSSHARQNLLQRLKLPFTTISPNVDETPYPNEFPKDLVKRLAQLKAQAVANAHPNSVIIGSDQIAGLDDAIIGKPTDHEDAVKQLETVSGKSIIFYNGLCVLNTATTQCEVVATQYIVTFRLLTRPMIEHYLALEKPYACACSLRAEGLGVALLTRMTGDDPSGLIGLPLITLTRLLQTVGVQVL